MLKQQKLIFVWALLSLTVLSDSWGVCSGLYHFRGIEATRGK